MNETTPITNRQSATRLWCAALLPLLACAALLFTGCVSSKAPGDGPIRLPGITDDGPQPGQVYAVIIRNDLPLDRPTDEAWALADEQVVPALTRGAWRGNGLRLGIINRDELVELDKAAPPSVATGTRTMNQSEHPIPIAETARLSGDLQFEIDLTRPPKPLQIETIKGGKRSTLRLLAHIETEDDGRHTLVLTPHHFVPSPLTLLPRDPREKELDGRIFNELRVRLTLDEDQIVMVGLYWPWPELKATAGDERDRTDVKPKPGPAKPDEKVAPADKSDPAAPPSHITTTVKPKPATDGDTPKDPPAENRIAPPLPTNFGSTLFTGVRYSKPVRTLLLITIRQVPKDKEKPQ